MSPSALASVSCPCLDGSLTGWLTAVLLGLALPAVLLVTGAILSHRRNRRAPTTPSDQEPTSPEGSDSSLG